MTENSAPPSDVRHQRPTVRGASLLGWLLLGAVYALLLWCLAAPPRGYALGVPNDDLFDEMVLQRTTLDYARQGIMPLYSDALEFPLKKSLLITHKSYLHVIFTYPLQLLLPWPQWWNWACLSAVWAGAMSAAWVTSRVSRNFLLSSLLGLTFLYLPWYKTLVAWGHLPQMWSAPLILALGCLHLIIWQKRTRLIPLCLAVLTCITALIYWIWGFLLALSGMCAVLTALRRLNRRQIKVLSLAVLLTLGCLFQVGVRSFSLDRELPQLQVGGNWTRQQTTQALTRAMHNGLGLASGRERVVLPGSSLVMPSSLLLGILLFYGGWRSRRAHTQAAWFWSLNAYVMALIGVGPALAWGDKVFCHSDGSIIRLPFYYLAQYTGLGLRWQLPETVTPLVLISLCLACSCQWNILNGAVTRHWNRKKRPGPTVPYARLARPTMVFMLLAGLTLSMSLRGLNKEGAGNLRRHGDELPGQKSAYWPCHKAVYPQFTRFLAAQEKGAVIDMPTGYCCNAWQLQHLHGHPVTHGKRPISFACKSNDFALLLLRLDGVASAGIPQEPLPDNSSSELTYGSLSPWTEDKQPKDRQKHRTPKHIGWRLAPSEAWRAERPISPQSVARAYADLYGQGARYIVLHRANCYWINSQYGDTIYANFIKILNSLWQAPVYRDQYVCIYKLNSPSSVNWQDSLVPWKRVSGPPPVQER